MTTSTDRPRLTPRDLAICGAILLSSSLVGCAVCFVLGRPDAVWPVALSFGGGGAALLAGEAVWAGVACGRRRTGEPGPPGARVSGRR